MLIGLHGYAVKTNNLIDASFGLLYFSNFKCFFWNCFLREKYNKNKMISVILVSGCFIYLLIKLGEIPWIGITVAVTFSLYGLIRKKLKFLQI